MPESIISPFGLSATALLIYFIFVNLRHGSKATKPEIRVNQVIAGLPLVIAVFFALLQAWYLILIQMLIAYLLIFTSLGHDIMALLLNNPAWYVAWLSGVMLLIFALTIWLIPWHLLDVGTYRDLRRNRAYLVVLRFLGFFTFVVFLLSIYALDQGWENFPGGLFWACLGLAFVGYWVLEIAIDECYIAQTLYWFLFLAAVLYVEISDPSLHYGWFKWVTIFWALFFWTITGPAPGFHKKKENEEASLDVVLHKKRGTVVGFFLQWIKQFQSIQTWLGLRIGKIAVGMDTKFNPKSNIKDEAKDLAKNPKERLNAYRFYGNRFSYRVLFITTLALALLGIYLPNLEPISPIVFVYTGMGFLLILVDYMYYTGRRVVAFATNPPNTAELNPNFLQKFFLKINWPNSAKLFCSFRLNLIAYVFWVVAVFVLFFASNAYNAQYNLLEKKPRPERLSFHQYLDQWTEARRDSLENPATKSYSIFIFSGEGGGSRAGYWSSSCLLGLDSLLELDLKQHTLAISAVSGSSPGTVAALAWWERGSRLDYQAYCMEIYKHNFISSGLAGNVFGATLRKFLRFFYFKNRNIRLCEEEGAAIERALNGGKTPGESVLSSLYAKDQFAWSSFSGLYQGQNQRWRTDLPLFFSNSTHVQTGRRVLINPVINLSAEQRFINVIDLCKRMEDSTKQELALVHAANLSELFPFMSASAHIPKLGNYADASYCENYGLKSAFEIYQACQDWKNSKAQDPLAAKCNFYVVALMNTHPTFSANSPNLPMEKSIPSETLAPLIAIGNVVLSNNPFSTREEIKSVLPNHAYHEMILNRSNLPLTRVLTKKNMRTMDSIRVRELKGFQEWYGGSLGY
ncbi:hypothetical protein [Haliscomenobacter sp.]|uniref:hypothetical protein n=1 Tax=Haliscomenobacter sp. TaxID=2717303 RepID=UPI003593A9E9